MRPRRKHAAIAVAFIGGAVLASSAFIFRNDIVEMWHLARLGSTDPDVRRAALAALAPLASGRSVPALIRVVQEDSPLRHEALEVLLAASPRMHPRERRDAALSLRGVAERGQAMAIAYHRLAMQCPDLYPLLADDLRGRDRTLRDLAAKALIGAWPRSRHAIFAFADKADPPDLLAFLGLGFGFVETDRDSSPNLQAAMLGPQSRGALFLPEGLAEDIPGAADVTRTLLVDHERPEARAAALGFAVCRSADDPGAPDLGLLKEVYARDPSFLVRRAALRLAAYAGEAPMNLDLSALPWLEPDRALRAAAILARDAWSFARRDPWLEIFDGAVATWAPRPHPVVMTPWSEDEARALEGLLGEENDPALRDAASMALAGRYARFIDSRMGPPTMPGLEVREWSLIRRADALAGDASRLELPEFVRGPTEAWQQADDALFVSHGAIFFDTASPLSLLVLLEPCEKLPLDAYPRSTSYFAAHPGLQGRRIDPDAPGARFLLHPAGNRTQEPLEAVPRHGPEWCGARVGHEERLEPRPIPVPSGSRWDLLRKAAAKDIALGGASERFLFYAGRLGVSSPVRTFREDSRVHVAVRPLDGMPCKPSKGTFALTPIPALLVIEKTQGSPPRGRLIENLDGDTPPRSVNLRELDLDEAEVVETLRGILARAGLPGDQAAPLIESSRKELFEGDGVRIAWILPRWIHDAIARLTVLPAPEKIARVGLVVEEVGSGTAESVGANDRPLLWEFEPGSREEVEAEFTESRLPSLPSEPLALEGGRLDGVALDVSADGSRALIQSDSGHYIADLGADRLIHLSPVKSPQRPWWPALSADGKHLAFTIWEEGRYSVHVADLERAALHTMALDLLAFPKASISGDGRRLAVCGGADGIHVFDLERSRAWFLRVGLCRDSVLELSGDGRKAVSIRPESNDDEDILLVDLETGATLDVSRSVGRELLPSISRDGNRIAFVRTLPGLQGVWVADVAARSRTRISPPGSGGQFPSLSADGTHVVFTAGGKVWLRELSTGSLREAGSSEGGVGAHVSNDGKRTVFTVRDADGFHVRFERQD